MPENYSAQTLHSTGAPFSSGGSSFSGLAVGTKQSSVAATKVLQETDMGERDSLIQALNILFDADNAREEVVQGLDLMPESLRDLLGLTRNGAAWLANNALLSGPFLASHLSQLPVDSSLAVKGLSDTLGDKNKFFKTQQASTLDVDKELQEKKSNFSANCQALCENFDDIFKQMSANVEGVIDEQGSAAESHLYFIKKFAVSSGISGMSSATLVALMFDALGSSFRELSGAVAFSKQESLSDEEKNIYQAFGKCCQSFTKSRNLKESLAALQGLEEAILNVEPATNMVKDHGITSPSSSVFLRMITAEPFVKTLKAVNASAQGVGVVSDVMIDEKDQSQQTSQNSIGKASLIQGFSGGDAVSHSENVSEFCELFDEAMAEIDEKLNKEELPKRVASSAKSTMGSNGALTIASSLIPGFSGLILRELSGSVDFTLHDKGQKKESRDVSRTRKNMSGEDLDNLMTRVSQLQERLERCNELGVTAPVSLGMGEASASGAMIASLNVVAGMLSALKEIRSFSQSPNPATELNANEKEKADGYVESAIEANKKTGKSTGMQSASEKLSMHQHLQSVMEKVVLINRSNNDFRDFGKDRHDINSVAKSTVGFTQGNSIGFSLGSLGVIALSALESGIALEALFSAFLYSTQMRRASDGVDKIESGNGSKFNLSSVSNTTRLAEERQNSSVVESASKTTYLGAESLTSRSLTVALCHSGALVELLRRIIDEEGKELDNLEGHLKSTVVSDRMMPQLYDKILKVLDDAERDHNPIPGLNSDMASSLSGVSNVVIASALSSHSVLITPVLESIAAAKKASLIDEAQKNEGLSDNGQSQRLSVVSNIIQAFTINFIKEIKHLNNPIQESTSIAWSENKSNYSIISSALLSLACEELFELCMSRSWALLDEDKVANSIKEVRELSKEEAGVSTKAVKEDSGLGQERSLSHISSAMRLTLSHLGVALGEIACELEGSPSLLKNDLDMHYSQQVLLASMMSSLSAFSKSILALSGGLSNFPLSSAGVAEDLRKPLHSTDHHLVIEQNHSSVHSTNEFDTESSLVTGFATDCASSLMTSATKLLLQLSVLGLDSSLAVTKIMEILSIHPRPLQALSLETQAASQPNGLTKNTGKQVEQSFVLTTLGIASAVAASQTGQSDTTKNSLLSLQGVVDDRIEHVEMLKDEEEERDEEIIGLKTFYELIIAALDKGRHEGNYKDLVTRFNHGGIALCSYHSEYGGIVGAKQDKKSNPLINKHGFHHCDDAASLLTTFINKAFDDEKNKHKSSATLLDEMKQKLAYKNLSSKTEQRWQYVVNKVMDRVKQENTRQSILNPSRSRKKQSPIEERRKQLIDTWSVVPDEEKKDSSAVSI